MKVPRRLPAALLVIAAIAMLVHGPIAQYADYHDFADKRRLFGIPNALDVLSNVPFVFVGAWGLWVFRAQGWKRLGAALPGYTLFAAGLILTALGSGFYHWAPGDFRLIFDRIPIALTCAGLLSGVRAATVAPNQPAWFTALLAVIGVASVIVWSATADLRPYLYIQFAPLVVVPLWQAISGDSSGNRMAFVVAIGLYGLAKVAEVEDRAIFAGLGFMSGHTLKHLLAAGASVALLSLALLPRLPAPKSGSS